MKINENIAFAKAILNRKNISPDSEEWKDYLKIREIVGNNHGYVGILTKLRFIDNITDMDEIESIFNILKNSKIDISKLIKMSYDDILHTFYDELSNDKFKNKDLELVLVDKEYSYYRVYTYEGILKIGSPSWCLKTKSNWEAYQQKYPHQWVVVDNRYKDKLISPDNNYLHSYSSDKPWVRFGISVKEKSETIGWVANNDNNQEMSFSPKSYTFYGVLCTILNFYKDVKKPYYQDFLGCSPLEGTKTWHKADDMKLLSKRLCLNEEYLNDYKEAYIILSESYSSSPILLLFNDYSCYGFYPVSQSENVKYSDISGSMSKSIFEKYALNSKSLIYSGVQLKLKKITEEEITSNPAFIKKIDKWFVLDHNDNYYVVVNSDPGESYHIPTKTLTTECWEMENPVFWYLHKEKNTPYKVKGDFTEEVVNSFRKKKKGFWW